MSTSTRGHYGPSQSLRWDVLFSLLGHSPESEFYVPTFRNTLFYLHTTYTEGIKCTETLEYKIQTPGNHPNERIQRPEHGESLQSRIPSRYSLTWISNLQLILGTNIIVRSAVLTNGVQTLWNSWICANISMSNVTEFVTGDMGK